MYRRDTELRYIDNKDIYKLAKILGDLGGRKLMEIIPIKTTVEVNSADDDFPRKYSHEQIRTIENIILHKPHDSRLFGEILIDEWSTSGRKHERPTVGYLLDLLTKLQLWPAVEFVKVALLNEDPPERPSEGPAARFSISFSDDVFNGVKEMAEDSDYYPNTTEINANAKNVDSLVGNNVDYYMKYQRTNKQMQEESISPPKPPPRRRDGRSQIQQQHQQQQQQPQNQTQTETQTANEATTATPLSSNRNVEANGPQASSLQQQPRGEGQQGSGEDQQQPQQVDNLYPNSYDAPESISLNIPNFAKILSAESMPIPIIDLLRNAPACLNENSTTDLPYGVQLDATENGTDETSSPSYHQEENQSNASSNNDDIEPLEEFNVELPNLGIFGNQNSNNDSSLTTVTGTSGENSFETSINEISSSSNDEEPCKLSEETKK